MDTLLKVKLHLGLGKTLVKVTYQRDTYPGRKAVQYYAQWKDCLNTLELVDAPFFYKG